MSDLKQQLDARVEQGLIYRSVEVGDGYTYYLYNYSDKCQFERQWDEYTLMARGLILDQDDNILCRPFKKFFNLDELPAVGQRLPDEQFLAINKEDGSLGCLWFDPARKAWRVTTRGAFASEQAVWATEKIREWGWDCDKVWNRDTTVLLEIVYPENKIVLDYAGKTALFYLAEIDNKTGRSTIYNQNIIEGQYLPGLDPVPIWNVADIDNLRTFLKTAKGVEGVVLYYCEADFRVKMKAADYLRLHKIRNSITPLGVHEMFMASRLDDIIAGIPDEFYEDFLRLWDYFNEIFIRDCNIITTSLGMYRYNMRKQFADRVNNILPVYLRGAAFAWYDGKEIVPGMFMKHYRPDANVLDLAKARKV